MSALVSRWRQAMMDNYGTPPLALVSGSGAVVVDEAGREYVDLLGGIAVNSLGHAHPTVVAAVSKQVATLGHVSNLYVCEPPVALAELLLALAGRPGRVFFANSGAEANEAAFKLSRCTGRTGVVATVGGFHGRTMGALALTGQPAKADPFRPLPGEVTHVPYGDVAALAAAVTDATAMVILEPIQGENGVVVPPAGYLAAARRITARHGALLVLDEVQTGVGRTGHWFAHQADGVEPDVVTLAKGLGGGLPIGATLAFGPAADLLGPGSHGSTFGGNPVSCAAALAVISTIASEGLLDHVKRLGERLRRGIEALGHPLVAGVRGAGLLLGVTLTAPLSAALAGALREAGFLVNPIQPDVIRLAPPLILTAAQVDAFLAALPAALAASTGVPDRVAPVAPSGGAIPVAPVDGSAPTSFSTNPVAPREASA
ncbi:acetylornithine transaminase [Verrucosispora sp. WMMA2121]|uniref:acetylornithine transaminase n=2 Tax=Verrucosispora sp. WMMA2121 TaxID=3015164 RepID=UPI0022B69402|nr:acetylornithine transaminase [Verrucosispora sp. WMMA2121]MCZ7417948.1 acetylornithine transaminase [Verrucosispora sp. WMMA2121]MCZ7419608.1 acetylornithine transaminase [Verrucosispora sp. WMMA2121]